MFVARLACPSKDRDDIWTNIESSAKDFQNRGITLLYVSKRQESSDTSIIASAGSRDEFKSALHEILGIRADDRGLTIFPLVRMKLFDVPENIGKEASRYLITVKTTSSAAERIYQLLSELRPSSDIAFTYLAFINDMPCDTLTLSCFAKSNEHLQRFIQQELSGIHGITSLSVTMISKTKRLIPYSEMIDVLRRDLGDLRIARPLLDLSDLN